MWSAQHQHYFHTCLSFWVSGLFAGIFLLLLHILAKFKHQMGLEGEGGKRERERGREGGRERERERERDLLSLRVHLFPNCLITSAYSWLNTFNLLHPFLTSFVQETNDTEESSISRYQDPGPVCQPLPRSHPSSFFLPQSKHTM